jgi:hypothetical protein
MDIGAKHAPPSDFAAPVFYPSLQGPQLAARRERFRRFVLELVKETFGRYIRMLIEPLSYQRPYILEWLNASALGPRPSAALSVRGRANFAGPPSCS